MKEVVIVSAVRTPMGSFQGALSGVPATQLGAIAIQGALAKIHLDPSTVQEVFMGSVLQANLGQAPARQAALGAGLSKEVPCTTINKVCASGMKAIALAAQAIQVGDADIVVAGGMENMSQVPHYLPGSRQGFKFGDTAMVDGLTKDGLINVYDQQVMGVCADMCAKEHDYSREEQDAFALQSYDRSSAAWDAGKFDAEIVPVEITDRRGNVTVVDRDQEFTNIIREKVAGLRPAFTKDGTVTAANASTLNDGAAALVLMSAEKAAELGIVPLARIIASADAAHEPEWFTTAPAKAVPKALAKAGLEVKDIQFWELNEAFSVVGLVNMDLLGIDPITCNVNGGAVSLGHPLGCSGARIIVTLLHVLQQNQATYGAASICNGGGGASAMILERLN
ncbi:MAG TPA: acetyl-CoA C-acetyltransferase [Cryomorphaceae bacterium]|nr:MAG: acetyl-CoA acetyltransferase [Cryomorphaceae bacterium BACL7 MAG-120910-bin2]KRO68254.1 MAG: acetyl-CoA acetyltransferase [Cryomorphaceae bacterium BACL7 MAG-120322-bin74]KRO81959.1 MAG: acetyl-CoA acetyltransferase [Cryomorphaceae bacterium BACL7 MAG-121220-bin83]HAB31569.1 acetyl-CoA C-acetyltransferase [Cryomorphaceae bacterium]